MSAEIVRKVVEDYKYVTPPHLRDFDVLADRIVEALGSAPSHVALNADGPQTDEDREAHEDGRKAAREVFGNFGELLSNTPAARAARLRAGRETTPSTTPQKPRGAYVPLTEHEIDLIRACLDDGTYTQQEQKDIGLLCNMAVNCLLYAQEIERLRALPVSATPRITGLAFVTNDGVRKVGLVFNTQEDADAFAKSATQEPR